MSQTATTEPRALRNAVTASVPYPWVGGSQHLVLLRHQGSQRQPNPKLMLEMTSIGDTVLAAAFEDLDVYLPTPLAPPFDRLLLPQLLKEDLRLQPVRDGAGQIVGMLGEVPALFVRANRVLESFNSKNEGYNYGRAIAEMTADAARMMASVLRRGVIKVREKPGLMAHALAFPELLEDEVCISEEFAERLFRTIRKQLPEEEFPDLWSLDGFPVYAIRFPVANRWGVQHCYLRIVPGKGRFIGVNPWNLGKRQLGDEDGDCEFVLLRLNDLLTGKQGVHMAKRPRVQVSNDYTETRCRLDWRDAFRPARLGSEALPEEDRLPEKEWSKLIPPKLDTTQDRLRWIEAADSRGWVAVFTMMAWWCTRILNLKGLGIQTASEVANDMLEPFMEYCMDARKPGSALATSNFDGYGFMSVVMSGGDLNHYLPGLKELGIDEEAIQTLVTCWRYANGQLREYCSHSPIYDALVLNRRRMESSVIEMLLALKECGIRPEELYATIVNDLNGVRPILKGAPARQRYIAEGAELTYGQQWIANR